MTTSSRARLFAIALIVTGIVLIGIRLLNADQAIRSITDLTALSPFSNFPPELAQNVKALITIPIGILVLVLVRQFIGMPTLGTFMPVLIGVAFRETGPLVGFLLFAIILLIGICVRMFFSQLQLLLVPRLAAVLIVVVAAMLAVAFASVNLDLRLAPSASLFPLVILAMTIERLVVTWEESGPRAGLTHLSGSLFVALLSYAVMTLHWVEVVMFGLPEVLLILLGTVVMIGRYVGLRLNEYFRFNELARSR